MRGAGGQRTVSLIDFYRLPDATPHIETVLEPGEVIAAITVPASPAARRSHYLKVRDRASFEFAVVSAAVALEQDGARGQQARVALGGVGTKPWRVPQVESALAGASLDPAALRPAAACAKVSSDPAAPVRHRGGGGRLDELESVPLERGRVVELLGRLQDGLEPGAQIDARDLARRLPELLGRETAWAPEYRSKASRITSSRLLPSLVAARTRASSTKPRTAPFV